MNRSIRKSNFVGHTKGFSLVELLVVISIIGLLIGIVIPAVGGARKQARKADTINLVNGLSQSCSQFILDQRRVPGYFSQKEMGDPNNATWGFSNIENVMLDLAGGIVPTATTGDLTVGPTPTAQVIVRPGLIGTAQGLNKAYFSPKGKAFKVQDPTGDDAVEVGNRASSEPDIKKMPVLVDPEGTPLLIWTADDTVKQEITTIAEFTGPNSVFAQRDSSKKARYYWTSNSAFLNIGGGGSVLVGKKQIDQSSKSLLGGANTANAVVSLGAMLGNPNSPVPFSFPPGTPSNNLIAATAARGQVVIQAAGADGVYLSKSDTAGRRHNGVACWYSDFFLPAPGDDVLKGFDDIIISGN